MPKLLPLTLLLFALTAAHAQTLQNAPVVSTGERATRELVLSHRYLNLPVRHGAPKRHVSITIGDKVVRDFQIELADTWPDFWVFADLAAWQGQRATVAVDQLPAHSLALDSFELADELKGADPLYGERLRPQFHFSSRRGRINDPNGLVYYAGEYHLFYQLNPYGWLYGNKHWGHAISRDLVRWEERPFALFPDDSGQMFSGSGVVDTRNTAGFQTGMEKPLVLIYTAWGPPATQNLAYSNDRGRTWTKYSGNPVLGNVMKNNRDPKVFWHEPTQRWIMALYVPEPGRGPAGPDGKTEPRHLIQFYGSADLKAWNYLSQVEGFYECPDMVELPLDGDPKLARWVLGGANSDYMIGAFDGKTFTPETPLLQGQRGKIMYAGQIFNDAPGGRCVQIAWGRVTMPGMPFNHLMGFPCALSLRSTPAGPRLHWQPVPEITALHARQHAIKAGPLPSGENPLREIRGKHFDLRAEFEIGEAQEIGFTIRGVPIVYDVRQQQLSAQGCTAPLPATGGRVRLQILSDLGLLEIFGGDGLVYMPVEMQPREDDETIEVFARGGAAAIRSLDVAELRSIWPQPVVRSKD